jgi:hypothetical protein
VAAAGLLSFFVFCFFVFFLLFPPFVSSRIYFPVFFLFPFFLFSYCFLPSFFLFFFLILFLISLLFLFSLFFFTFYFFCFHFYILSFLIFSFINIFIVLARVISGSGYKYFVRVIITTCSDPCSDTTFVFIRDDTQYCSHYNRILFQQLFSFVRTLFFEKTYKLVPAIVISCSVYNNNVSDPCSDTIFVVRDDI